MPKGVTIRPTADRVKESVFNIIGGEVVGAAVLDLFAGAGSLGLEALSRGAASALFVDDDVKSLAALKRNIRTLELEDRTRIMRMDAARGPGRIRGAGPFGIVFLDPPYGRGLAVGALDMLGREGLVDTDGLVVVEHATRDELPVKGEMWVLNRERRYGQTMVSFFRPAAA